MGRASGGTPEMKARAQAEARRLGLSFLANVTDPLGIPSYLTGLLAPEARDAWREAQDGPLPGVIAGTMAAPIGLLGAPFKAAPKMAAGLTGAIALLAEPTPAGARPKKQQGAPSAEPEPAPETDPLWDAVKGEPALEAKYNAWKRQDALSRAPVQGVNAQSSDEVRRKAGEDAARLQKDLIDAVTALNPPRRSFQQSYPQAAEMMPFVQMGAGLAAGALTKNVGNMIGRGKYADWNRAVDRAEEAFDPGIMTRLFGGGQNLPKAGYETKAAAKHLEMYDKPGRVAAFAAKAAPIGAGAVTGAEANLLRYNYDRQNAPRDSEAYAEAEARLGTTEGWLKMMGQGAVMGGLGGLAGSKFRAVPAPRVPVARTEALKQRQKSELASQRTQASSGAGPSAPSPGLPVSTAAGPAPSPQPGLPLPQPGPRTPQTSYRSYDKDLDSPVSSQVLDEMLTAGGPISNKQGFLDHLMARYAAPGPRRQHVNKRVDAVLGRLDDMKSLGVDIYDPRIRQSILQQLASGRSGLLGIGAATPMFMRGLLEDER